jgi:hypothetical protein
MKRIKTATGTWEITCEKCGDIFVAPWEGSQKDDQTREWLCPNCAQAYQEKIDPPIILEPVE